MWFIDNHPGTTKHAVLPWHHIESKLEGTPAAAPRNKLRTARDFVLKTETDLARLQSLFTTGSVVERVVVEPEGPTLIRNVERAKELGALAEKQGFVVELSGGVLSHVFYILVRAGAKVECVDLFGADEEIVEFDKLVRDRVPEIIESRGERVETVRLMGEAMLTALREKLVEEAFEAFDAESGAELVAELADVAQVVKSIGEAIELREDEIEAERAEKEERRGGFTKGTMLLKTSTPRSIRTDGSEEPELTLNLSANATETVISRSEDLPQKLRYRRPDLRRVEAQRLEKLFTFETDLNKSSDTQEVLEFSLSGDDAPGTEFEMTVELRRKGVTLRGTIRLRRGPLQLMIRFPE